MCVHGHVKRKERGVCQPLNGTNQPTQLLSFVERTSEVSTAGLPTPSRIRISLRNLIGVNKTGWGGYFYQLDVCPCVELLPVLYWLCFLILACSTKYDGWTAMMTFRALSTVPAHSWQMWWTISVQVMDLLLTDVMCVSSC